MVKSDALSSLHPKLIPKTWASTFESPKRKLPIECKSKLIYSHWTIRYKHAWTTRYILVYWQVLHDTRIVCYKKCPNIIWLGKYPYTLSIKFVFIFVYIFYFDLKCAYNELNKTDGYVCRCWQGQTYTYLCATQTFIKISENYQNPR